MNDRPRIPLAEADELAAEVVTMLRAFCMRIEVAGSIRRRKEDVGDIEIVAVPAVDDVPVGLFADRLLAVDHLHARCCDFLAAGTFAHRPDKNGRPAFGAKFKRLLYRGFPLDLFSTTDEQWGVIYAIRTGPAEFSHRLVTPTSQGGLLPNWMKVHEGRIARRDTTEPYPTPEEEDVFRLVGLGFIPPEKRTGLERAMVAR